MNSDNVNDGSRTCQKEILLMPNVLVRIISLASIALATFAIIIGSGIVLKLAPLTYYADEWVWLNSIVVGNGDSFCRFWGHPTVTTSLALTGNLNFLDGSAQARAALAGAVNVLGMLLIGLLTTANVKISNSSKVAILSTFAAVGLSGMLTSKLFWSLGMTDGLVLIGSAMVAHGVGKLRHGTWAWSLIGLGTLLAVFSFGSGYLLPFTVVYSLICLRIRLSNTIGYILFASIAIYVALVALPGCELATSDGGTVSFAPWPVLKTAAITLGFFPAHLLAKASAWGAASPGLTSYWAMLGIISIALFTLYAFILLLRKQRDAYLVSLVAFGLLYIGAALLIGITRSATFGAEVGFEGRYSPISTAFGVVCFALLTRIFLVYSIASARVALVLSISALLAFTSPIHLSNYRSFHQHLAASAASVLIAGKDGKDSQNLKNYMGLSYYVMQSLPAIVARKKDLFNTPAGRAFMNEAAGPPKDLPSCKGEMFRMPQLDEPGIKGFGGISTSPSGGPLDYVTFYDSSHPTGAGFKTPLGSRVNSQSEVDMMSGISRELRKYAPYLADAYNVGPGWVGLNKSDDESPIVVGASSEGQCRILPAG